MFDTGKAMFFPDAKKASTLMMWAYAQFAPSRLVSFPIPLIPSVADS